MLVSNSKKVLSRDEIMNITLLDCIPGVLKKFIEEGKYNEGDNLIFKELKKNNSQEMYNVALDFYQALLEKEDDDLEKNNFLREEVYDSLEEIKKYV